jgi:hypothetical protein
VVAVPPWLEIFTTKQGNREVISDTFPVWSLFQRSPLLLVMLWCVTTHPATTTIKHHRIYRSLSILFVPGLPGRIGKRRLLTRE